MLRHHHAPSFGGARWSGRPLNAWLAAAVVAASMLATGSAEAQPAAQAPAAAEGASAPTLRVVSTRGTREDLARAYLRLERSLASEGQTLTATQRREVEGLFDQAAMRLYGAGYRRALAFINQAWIKILEQGAALRALDASEAQYTAAYLRAATALRATVNPAVVVLGEDGRSQPVRISVGPMYDWTVGLTEDNAGQFARKVSMELRVHHPNDVLAARLIVSALPDRAPSESLKRFSEAIVFKTPGVARITVKPLGEDSPAPELEIGAIRIAARSLDEVRAEVLATLDALDTPAANEVADSLATARAIARARAELLTDAPSPNESSEFLHDPAQLARDVQDELAAIEQGVDPYRGRVGDRWQVVLARGVAYPARLFAPKQTLTGEPLPLVIAFHGAGGDENLFMDGYAAGRLKALADERGFLLVTPRTSPFASSPVFLEGLLETVEAHYNVDRNRVYVMGHSLGAGVTAGLARLAHESIAACVCLAGGGAFETNGGSAPTLVYAAELDPIIPAWRTIEGAERAKKGGLPIECVLVRDRGHTLFIGDVLDDAVDWLFARTLAMRDGDAAPGATAP